jgi:acyl transferase domain-containing protein/NAD(P)-dependent dehydrogenase (short-subunit alcohol dehydrogenase family)
MSAPAGRRGADPIAVVGIGCRFAPSAAGPDELWSALCEGVDAVGPIPADRWDRGAFFDPNPAKPGKMDVDRGAFLEQPLEAFDASFFGIAPVEAAQLDPQQRLLLEVTWEAIEDAGIERSGLRGSEAGVFIGAFTLDNMIERAGPGAREDIRAQTAMTCTHTVLSSRLAYVFDLRGPCMTIDTACSSSLVAVHQACRALTAGECELAIAGGVSRIFRPETFLLMAKGGFLAPDGRSKSFSRHGDGYGRGEGCGVVVLKRLDDAVSDRDRIYAVVEGTGVNQDGRTGGMAVPSVDAQVRLIESVAVRADVDPADVQYVEAHGTGTFVGDPIEMASIGAVYGRAVDRSRPCVVGSLKAGLGHTEGAAGVAGFVKAVLVAHHGVVPPQAWLDELNPDIDFGGLGLQVATSTVELPLGAPLRRVAVNSFGYGGTNAHAVLREPTPPERAVAAAAPPERARAVDGFGPLVLLSGHTPAAVEAMAEAYADRLRRADGEARRSELLAAFAGRTAQRHRVAIIGEPESFIETLDVVARGEAHPDALTGRAEHGDAIEPAFVFSGMGPQWWGMARGLLEDSEVFAASVRRGDAIFRRISGWSILEAMLADESRSRMSSTEVAQPANVLLQIGLVDLLASLGVRPSAVVGHSVGEIAAGYAAGAVDLESAVFIAYHRSRLQASTAGTGSMLATGLSADDAQDLLDRHGPAVALAAVNGPGATTLAGDAEILERIERELTDRKVFCRPLRVEVAYHSPAMDPILDELERVLRPLTPTPATIPLFSSVSPADDDGDWDASFWIRNVRDPVGFHDAAQRLIDAGNRLLLEIGPHPVLAMPLHALLVGPRPSAVIPTLRRDRLDRVAVRDALVALWSNGVPVEWSRLLGTAPPGLLPLYPWQREHHWQESGSVRRERTGEKVDTDLLQGRLVTTSPNVVDVELSDAKIPWLRDHVVGRGRIFPAAGFLEVLVARARSSADGSLPVVVEDVEIAAPLVLAEDADTVLRVIDGHGGRLTLASRQTGEDEAWRTHVTARVARGVHRSGIQVAHDVDGTSVDVEDLYATFRRLGIDHRGEFRSLTTVVAGGSQVRIDVERREPSPTNHRGSTLHPPCLDAVFQGLLATGPLEDAVLHLPVRVGRLVVLDELPDRFTAHVAMRRRTSRRIVADADLVDPSGRLVATLRDVAVHRAPPLGTETDRWLDGATYEAVWRRVEDALPSSSTPPPSASWHVVGPTATALSALIREDGEDRAVVDHGIDDVAGVTLRPGDVLLLEVDDERPDRIDREVGRLLRLISSAERGGTLTTTVVLLTQRSVAARPEDSVCGWVGSWAVGFRRAMANELPDIRARLIDHDGVDSVALRTALLHSDAEELAVRADSLYQVEVERRPANARARTWWDVAPTMSAADVPSFALAQRSASPDGLVWVRNQRRPPDDDEVELRIDAVGLNHKDLLKVLGAFPEGMAVKTFTGAEPGMEQCVVVERVGRRVHHIAPGDRFLASVPDGFRRHVTVRPDQVRLAPCPADWTSVEAAGQLVALSTAHRTIVEIGRVGAGDTLLVHGATGAVGLATIQAAAAVGARVLATAGTEGRRRLAIAKGASHCFDSRSLAFVDDVLAVTAGRGVDLALNTLVGEDGLRAIFDVTADGGCVVEVGKRAMGRSEHLPLDIFDRNVGYVSFDLDHLVRDQASFDRLATSVLTEVERGSYRPIPVTAVPASSVAQALRSMGRGGHTGKLVVDLVDETGLRCAEPFGPGTRIAAEASYLVSGGTGGVGVEVARWLVARGARRIALLSRRGRTSGDATAVLAALESAGAEVTLAAVDVTDTSAVVEFLRRWRRSDRPLRGVVHAAGVAHDVPVTSLTEADVRQVVDPKVAGALALHHATVDDPLDLFLVTSSVSAWTGTSGQAAYSAANSVLEGFTQWRRRSGRPSTCISLGPVADVGMAALTDEIAQYVRVLGFEPLPPSQLDAVLDRVVEWDRPVLGIFDLSWLQWSHAEPGAAGEGRFRDLVREARSGAGAGATSMRDRLAAMPIDEREPMLARLIVSELATVVGMDAADLDVDDGLLALGLDSLMLVELQTRLNATLGTSLSVMGLLSRNSAREIAAEVAGCLD